MNPHRSYTSNIPITASITSAGHPSLPPVLPALRRPMQWNKKPFSSLTICPPHCHFFSLKQPLCKRFYLIRIKTKPKGQTNMKKYFCVKIKRHTKLSGFTACYPCRSGPPLLSKDKNNEFGGSWLLALVGTAIAGPLGRP